MRLTKSTLMGTGSLVLAGVILSLLTPQAVHAIAATAVLVENTTATPVPVQSVMPGKPFHQFCQAVASASCDLGPPVPAGYTFVAQFANAYTITNNSAQGNALVNWAVQTQGAGVGYQVISNSVLGNTTIYAAPVTWYIDGGSSPTAITNNDHCCISTTIFSLTGYLTQ